MSNNTADWMERRGPGARTVARFDFQSVLECGVRASAGAVGVDPWLTHRDLHDKQRIGAFTAHRAIALARHRAAMAGALVGLPS